MARRGAWLGVALGLTACAAPVRTPSEVQVQRPGPATGGAPASPAPTLRPEEGLGEGLPTGALPSLPSGNLPPGGAASPGAGPTTGGGASLPPSPGPASAGGQVGWVASGQGQALTGLPGPGAVRQVPGLAFPSPKALAVVGGAPVLVGGGRPSLVLARQVLQGKGWSLGHREVGGLLTEAFPDVAPERAWTAVAADGAQGLVAAAGASLKALALRPDALTNSAPAFTEGEELVPKPQEAPEVSNLVALAVAAKPTALTGRALPDDAASLAAVGPFPLATGSVVAVDANQHRVLLLRPGAQGWTRRVLLGQGRVSGAAGAVAPLEDLSVPSGVALRPDGRAIAIADTGRRRIVLMEASATAAGGFRLSLLAGDGSPGAVDGPGPQASFARPVGLAYAPSGLLVVADEGNQGLRGVDLQGRVGRLRFAQAFTPTQVAWAGEGRWWVLDARPGQGLLLVRPQD